MTKIAQNTFEKGLRIDNDASLQEGGTYVAGHNIDIAEIGAKLAALNVRGSNLAANVTSTIITDDAIQVLGAYRTSADIDRGSGFVQREGIILFVKGATPPPPAQALQPIVTPDAGIYSGFVGVTVTNQRAGETIYYTTDGSVPTEASTIYGGIVVVSTTTTLRLRAFSPILGVPPSNVTTVSYVISALTATISPAAGTYLSSRVVTLGSSSDDAVIYYTLDGSTPDDTSTQYTSPFTLTENATVKAIAIITGIATSAIAESAFGIQLIAPELTSSGTNINDFEWTANNPNLVGDIRYTTDGSTPNGSSTLYTAPITVSATTNVKAAVFNATNVTSAITDRTYTVQCDEPTISPNGGDILISEFITLSTTTSGADIRYTTNGSEPTISSTLYSSPFSLLVNTTLKAKAFKTGTTPSVTNTVFFFVIQQVVYVGVRDTNQQFYSFNYGSTWTQVPSNAGFAEDASTNNGINPFIVALNQASVPSRVSRDEMATWQTLTSATNWMRFVRVKNNDVFYTKNPNFSAAPYVYISDDLGVTFTGINPNGITTAKAWNGFKKGNIIFTSDEATGDKFISFNNGSSWNSLPSSGVDSGTSNISSNNQIISFQSGSGGNRSIWVSRDGGITWNEEFSALPTGDNYVMADTGLVGYRVTNAAAVQKVDLVANTITNIGTLVGGIQVIKCNFDGTKIIARSNLRIYISVNSGVTWSELQPIGNVTANWRAIEIR